MQKTYRSSTICPECGHRNRAAARLCTECYAVLRREASSEPALLRRANRGGRHRAEAIRAQVSRTETRETPPFAFDWKIGAILAGFLGLLGLRKTEVGKNIRKFKGVDLLDKLR